MLMGIFQKSIGICEIKYCLFVFECTHGYGYIAFAGIWIGLWTVEVNYVTYTVITICQ